MTFSLPTFWYRFVAVLVCGRFRLWPFWMSPVSPRRHLGRFSHFCRVHERDQQTDTQTDRPRYSACSDRPLSLANAAMRPISSLSRRCFLIRVILAQWSLVFQSCVFGGILMTRAWFDAARRDRLLQQDQRLRDAFGRPVSQRRGETVGSEGRGRRGTVRSSSNDFRIGTLATIARSVRQRAERRQSPTRVQLSHSSFPIGRIAPYSGYSPPSTACGSLKNLIRRQLAVPFSASTILS